MSPCFWSCEHVYGQETHFCKTSTKIVFLWHFRDTFDITDPQIHNFIHDTYNQNQPYVLTPRCPKGTPMVPKCRPGRYSYHCTPNFNRQSYFIVTLKNPILSIIWLPWCPNWVLMVPGRSSYHSTPKNIISFYRFLPHLSLLLEFSVNIWLIFTFYTLFWPILTPQSCQLTTFITILALVWPFCTIFRHVSPRSSSVWHSFSSF